MHAAALPKEAIIVQMGHRPIFGKKKKKRRRKKKGFGKNKQAQKNKTKREEKNRIKKKKRRRRRELVKILKGHWRELIERRGKERNLCNNVNTVWKILYQRMY